MPSLQAAAAEWDSPQQNSSLVRGVRIHHWGREKELDAAVAKIGKNIAAVQGDVSNLQDLDRLYAKGAEDKGRVDVVFANAGIGNQMAPLGSITEEQIDRTFNVNVRGLIFTVQKALPLMHASASTILNASEHLSRELDH